jgi:hypothetical protein
MHSESRFIARFHASPAVSARWLTADAPGACDAAKNLVNGTNGHTANWVPSTRVASTRKPDSWTPTAAR